MTPATLTVDLVRADVKGAPWHIVAIPAAAALCGYAAAGRVERGVDAHVIAHRGVRVCAKCRRVLR